MNAVKALVIVASGMVATMVGGLVIGILDHYRVIHSIPAELLLWFGFIDAVVIASSYLMGAFGE